jgi:hypothetical protein
MRRSRVLGLLTTSPHNEHACRGRQVALDVAEALDYLHTQLKVMHSDLKPGCGTGHCSQFDPLTSAASVHSLPAQTEISSC